jgi:uncharacterized protein YkwD
LEKSKTKSKHSKISRKSFLKILSTFLFFMLFFILVLFPGCRLLFFPAAAHSENNNGARNSKVWEESVISMNNALKQFAAGAGGLCANLNGGKSETSTALNEGPESYLGVLLNKYDIAPGGISPSEGGRSSVCTSALYSFYDNLTEQLKLFKNKTGQSGIKAQKVASTSGETAEQQEAGTGQDESQVSSGQEQQDLQEDKQQPAEQQTSPPDQAAGFATSLISLINNARNSNGLPSLSINPTLNNIAKSRCDDMISRDYFSHVSPDGKDIKAILVESGIMYKVTGENLQYCFPPSMAGPELFFNTWMDSEIHRANMLGSGYTQIGIALSSSADKAVAVLVFLG